MTASNPGSRDGRAANWATVVAVLISAGALIGTSVSSQHQLDLSRKGQIADRFSTTVELLSSEGTGKRLGGIYALEQIANESPEYRTAVKNALAGFVRVSSHQSGPTCAAADLAQYPDIAAAVAILADQIPKGGPTTTPARWANNAKSFIDLAGSCLRGTNLERSRLNYARLSGADMGDSAFDGASLQHAQLGASGSEIMTNGSDYVAYLESLTKGNLNIAGASFREADLSDADLSRIWVRRSCGPQPSLWFNGATLTGANMWQSAIPDAIFVGANMDGMTITASSFVGAEFDAETSMRDIKVDKWINFEQADLRGVNLTGLTFVNPLSGQHWPKINFRNANLQGADLRGLNLKDADFSGADLREANLDDIDQLTGARWDGWTLWPDGIVPTAPPAVVPSLPPPLKPDTPAPYRVEPGPAAPDPRPDDQRVTVETKPDGGVRIEIAPPSSPWQKPEGSPPSSGQSAPNPFSNGPGVTYNNGYGSSKPDYYTGHSYNSTSYYTNYSGLNYASSSEFFTECQVGGG